MPRMIYGSIWPQPDDRVFFLGKNGYDSEREQAMKVFEVGTYYTVAEIEIGQSSSTFMFEEVPGYWNTVMFQYDHDLEEPDWHSPNNMPIPDTWK